MLPLTIEIEWALLLGTIEQKKNQLMVGGHLELEIFPTLHN